MNIERNTLLASQLFDLIHCVSVHGFRGTAHHTVSISLTADLDFLSSSNSHWVGLCHGAHLEVDICIVLDEHYPLSYNRN